MTQPIAQLLVVAHALTVPFSTLRVALVLIAIGGARLLWSWTAPGRRPVPWVLLAPPHLRLIFVATHPFVSPALG